MSHNIKFVVKSKKEKTILEVANKNDIKIKAPCKKGKCGKCLVKAKGKLNPVTKEESKNINTKKLEEGYRLACMAKVIGDCEIEL